MTLTLRKVREYTQSDLEWLESKLDDPSVLELSFAQRRRTLVKGPEIELPSYLLIRFSEIGKNFGIGKHRKAMAVDDFLALVARLEKSGDLHTDIPSIKKEAQKIISKFTFIIYGIVLAAILASIAVFYVFVILYHERYGTWIPHSLY